MPNMSILYAALKKESCYLVFISWFMHCSDTWELVATSHQVMLKDGFKESSNAESLSCLRWEFEPPSASKTSNETSVSIPHKLTGLSSLEQAFPHSSILGILQASDHVSNRWPVPLEWNLIPSAEASDHLLTNTITKLGTMGHCTLEGASLSKCTTVEPVEQTSSPSSLSLQHSGKIIKKLHPIGQVLSKSKKTQLQSTSKKKTPGVNTSKLPPSPWRSFKAKCQSPSSTTPHLHRSWNIWKILMLAASPLGIPTPPTLIFQKLPGYHQSARMQV